MRLLETAERADQLLDEGDVAGAETWCRILNAIERMQAKAPAEGEERCIQPARLRRLLVDRRQGWCTRTGLSRR